MLRAHPLLLQLALPLQPSLVDLVGVGVQSADDSQRLRRDHKPCRLERCYSQQLQSGGLMAAKDQNCGRARWLKCSRCVKLTAGTEGARET